MGGVVLLTLYRIEQVYELSWQRCKERSHEKIDDGVDACGVVVERRGLGAGQTRLRVHGDTGPGRDPAGRTLHPGRRISPRQAWRDSQVSAGEKLPGRRYGVHQWPGPARLVRRLHRR